MKSKLIAKNLLSFGSDWVESDTHYCVDVSYLSDPGFIEVIVSKWKVADPSGVENVYLATFGNINRIPQFKRFDGKIREEIYSGYWICRVLHIHLNFDDYHRFLGLEKVYKKALLQEKIDRTSIWDLW